MGVQLGNILPNKIQMGGVEVDKIMVGGVQVYPNSTPDTTPPSVPGAMLISLVSTSSYNLTAGVSSDAENNPVEYRFYKDNVAQGSWQSSNQYTETGEAAGSTAVWKVKARDSAPTPNESAFGSTFTAGTLTVAPVLSFVSSFHTTIDVSYSDPTGRNQFVIEYKESSAGTWELGTNSSNSTSFQITGLTPDTEYNVRVRATNVNGLLSASSNIITASTVPDEIQ